MKINYNISAIIANNQLGKAENRLETSLERLSSGYKINSAKDDPAGLAISKKMRQQINALDRASQNALDGQSLLETAEGALTEVQAMLQRMRELNVQVANGTNTTADKLAIQEEVDALVEEIDRLSEDTEFNGMSILNGSLDQKAYTSQHDNVKVTLFSDSVDTQSYTIDVTALATQAVALTGTVNLTDPIPESMAGTVTINGVDIDIEAGDTVEEVYEKLNQGAEYADVNMYATDGTTAALTIDNLESAGYNTTTFTNGTSQLLFVSEDYGSDAHVNISSDNATLLTALGLAGSVSEVGTDTQLTLGTKFPSTASYTADGDTVTITAQDGFEMEVSISALTDMTNPIELDVTDMGSLIVQVGAREGQAVDIRIPDCGAEALGIDDLNMVGSEGIERSLDAIDDALDRVTEIRASIGAYENRLESTISGNDATSENMTEAYSRVMDTDMAEEMTEYTQQNVITQAATAMLAQANDRPETVLQLLS